MAPWRLRGPRVGRGPQPGGDHAGRQHDFHDRLRTQLAAHLRVSRGLLTDPERVFVFAGVNAAIRTITQAVARPDTTLAFEDPGYATARRAFLASGADVRPVPVDDEGVIVDRLLPSDWGAYVTPAHQFPMGARLSVGRRSALLEWAAANDAVVFEDDYDGEFRYDVPPMPALSAMTAGAERVIYLGTASKILARDLRLAWAVVPPALCERVRDLLLDEGDTVSPVPAAALADFIESGSLIRQISSSHRTYAARRDRFAVACHSLLPEATLHGVEAGLHVVLTFGDAFDDVLATTELRAAGVACAPLSRYSQGDRRHAGLVCGYARLPETRAVEVVTTMRDVLGAGRG